MCVRSCIVEAVVATVGANPIAERKSVLRFAAAQRARATAKRSGCEAARPGRAYGLTAPDSTSPARAPACLHAGALHAGAQMPKVKKH